ncbi:MAG: gamma-glutamyltransferase [Planctomycetes bacterium]|nr:gamma-glutamyltransferase [Planctomycetota bacterium]
MKPTLLAVLPLLALPAVAGDRITGAPFATRSEVLATHGMVATSQPLATQAALDVLKAGGNAVDAALCANAVLGLVEPTGNGIGGDLFAIVWDAKTRQLHGYNGSGRSPRALTLEHLRALGLEHVPATGPLPVSVPGCVDGWFALHERFGSLPMSAVLAPAIRYAREGFPVTQLIAHYWDLSVPRLAPYPGFVEQMTLDGRAPREGELWRNANLARTLEALAEGGRAAFYEGAIAHTIADYVQAQGGFLAYEDLATHRGEWVAPISTSYRGVELWELPPNGQGLAALQILNVLEGYDLAAMGFGSADHVHAFVEAKKLAFEDRAAFYADPDVVDVPVARLVSKAYAAERRALVDMQRAAKRYAAGHAALEEGDTIYLCTADAAGNMVSLIQSNYRGMGSGMTPPGLGFVLQDRGELFDLEPGRANTYAPGKRPFHTIIPAFLTKDGEPWVAFGVMGGATQPQAHAQIVMNLVDFGMNLQEAGDAPRILHSGSSQPTGERMTDGGEVALESGFAYATIRELVQRGHKLVWEVGPYGGYQAILRDPATGVLHGASESRKDGQAAGW